MRLCSCRSRIFARVRGKAVFHWTQPYLSPPPWQFMTIICSCAESYFPNMAYWRFSIWQWAVRQLFAYFYDMQRRFCLLTQKNPRGDGWSPRGRDYTVFFNREKRQGLSRFPEIFVAIDFLRSFSTGICRGSRCMVHEISFPYRLQ